MTKIIEYIKGAFDELKHKVSWPSWKELQGSAIVVSVASLIIAFVIFAMDKSFSKILTSFYSLF